MLNKVRLMPKYITSESHVVRDQLCFIPRGGGEGEERERSEDFGCATIKFRIKIWAL